MAGAKALSFSGRLISTCAIHSAGELMLKYRGGGLMVIVVAMLGGREVSFGDVCELA